MHTKAMLALERFKIADEGGLQNDMSWRDRCIGPTAHNVCNPAAKDEFDEPKLVLEARSCPKVAPNLPLSRRRHGPGYRTARPCSSKKWMAGASMRCEIWPSTPDTTFLVDPPLTHMGVGGRWHEPPPSSFLISAL
jgi:hypothetical protein